MGKKRATLFDEKNLEDEIDISELTTSSTITKITDQERKILEKEASKIGFISREPKKRRKLSPYTAQFGGKCREGMKELFQDVGEHLDMYDTQTLELAIIALIEKENLEDLEKRYYKLINTVGFKAQG